MLKLIGYFVVIIFGPLVLLSTLRSCNEARDAKLSPAERAVREQARAKRLVEDAKQAAEKKVHEEEKACSDTTMAFVMSQSFVKEQLKAPGSADFPYSTSDGVKINYLGNCIHQVRAYVDSQNGFGAKIRTKYYTKLKNEKGTDSWELLEIKLGG